MHEVKEEIEKQNIRARGRDVVKQASPRRRPRANREGGERGEGAQQSPELHLLVRGLTPSVNRLGQGTPRPQDVLPQPRGQRPRQGPAARLAQARVPSAPRRRPPAPRPAEGPSPNRIQS